MKFLLLLNCGTSGVILMVIIHFISLQFTFTYFHLILFLLCFHFVPSSVSVTLSIMIAYEIAKHLGQGHPRVIASLRSSEL